ncbi:MAG: rhodanese-like domain-containing protein [Bacteroidia bacterium]
MRTVIVDVRTKKEFNDFCIPGSVNIPSNSFGIRDFEPFKNSHISLICETGRRAANVMTELKWAGFSDVSILDKQMSVLAETKSKNSTEGWTIDRQFRLTLAVLLGISFLGIFVGILAAWSIPLIIFAGLLYSSISNNCFLKMLITAMPWNRKVA